MSIICFYLYLLYFFKYIFTYLNSPKLWNYKTVPVAANTFNNYRNYLSRQIKFHSSICHIIYQNLINIDEVMAVLVLDDFRAFLILIQIRDAVITSTNSEDHRRTWRRPLSLKSSLIYCYLLFWSNYKVFGDNIQADLWNMYIVSIGIVIQVSYTSNNM